MSRALAQFLRRELDERGETAEQFARRAGLNSSGLYQILREERLYVQDRTLDKIAAGLGMTPAGLASALGKGLPQDSGRRAVINARLQQVPDDELPKLEQLIEIFIPGIRHAKGRRGRDANATDGHDRTSSNEVDPGFEGPLTAAYRFAQPALAHSGA